MRETINRRYLGGIRFLDVSSGTVVRTPLDVTSPQARFFVNRGGIYVVASADGLEEHLDSFEAPPSDPSPEAIIVDATVIDRQDIYLPRRFRFALPRTQNTRFQPIDVPLYPSPRARREGNWAEVRATIRSAAITHSRLSGAFARIIREADGQEIGRGMTELAFDPRAPGDPRPTVGELLLFVPGIPITLWGQSEGPVIVNEIPTRMEVVFDPDAGTIPDPDALASLPALASNQFPLLLAAGRAVAVGELLLSV